MIDIGVKLHPIKKLQLWQAIRKAVFGMMDNDYISPERADEILTNLKPKIVEIISPKQAKEFYLALPQMYTELAPVTNKFEIQEEEALDKILALLLDEIMDKGNFDLASEIMEKIQNSNDHKKLIEEFQNKFPIEFQICLKRFSQKFA
jgi:hypothetical protein